MATALLSLPTSTSTCTSTSVASSRPHRRARALTVTPRCSHEASSSPESELSPTLGTKLLLPNKKPLKWSTGTAPGEYGGPPTTSGLRRYWGGGDDDPVTATDDFIWNKDFVPRLKRLLHNDPISSKFTKEPTAGFLSLNRAFSLDIVDIDLSKELQPPPKPVLEYQVEAARRGISNVEASNGSSSPRWRLAPTRREQDKWERASKAATGGTDVILRESRQKRGDPKVLAAQSMQQYNKLKEKLQILTLGIGGIGVVSAYFSYSPEIAASFGAGLAGSLMYLRMLGRTVDSMASSSGGLMRGAVGQPRLLVPIALVMIYNRWNEILVPQYGLMHLELIPMLVGFFTYKVSTFIQAIDDAVSVAKKPEV
ncbi:ATP synthase protein I-related protein [Rhynchospora pubera]|uniref:ATP synthase protein I-related protein n=1 Tax=Rhynchospora pubera TaxID=906938 RepID=A0AAV8I0H0_9POAL|nr:ATP synthase protein I-related protein [Rhynchospora pubera]